MSIFTLALHAELYNYKGEIFHVFTLMDHGTTMPVSMAPLLDIRPLKVNDLHSTLNPLSWTTLGVCYSTQNSWRELKVHGMKTLLWCTENLCQVFQLVTIVSRLFELHKVQTTTTDNSHCSQVHGITEYLSSFMLTSNLQQMTSMKISIVSW